MINNHTSSLVAACLMAAAGSAVFLALPMLVGLIMDETGMSEEQAGLVASAYFGAYMLASGSAFVWARHFATARAAQFAYFLSALGLGVAASAGFDLLKPGFAIAGVGGGMLFSLAVATVSRGGDTDRSYGWLLVSQQLFAAVFLFVAPAFLVARWGLTGPLAALSLSFVLMALTATGAGGAAKAPNSAGKTHTVRARQQVLIGLAALVAHFCALSALWAFVERLAVDNGLSTQSIGAALSASMLAGLAGGFAVTRLGDRLGRRKPLFLATTLFLAVCLGLGLHFNLAGFLALVALLSFAWNFVLAYQMGIISDIDREQGFAILIPAAQGVGATLGPIAGGAAIASGGYTLLLWMTAATCLVTITIFGFLVPE